MSLAFPESDNYCRGCGSSVDRVHKINCPTSTPSAPQAAKPETCLDEPTEEGFDDFWKFCEEYKIDGTHRIDKYWRVDEVAVAYSRFVLRRALAAQGGK
jgi:hypothetical protein